MCNLNDSSVCGINGAAPKTAILGLPDGVEGLDKAGVDRRPG